MACAKIGYKQTDKKDRKLNENRERQKIIW